ncbi:MAG: polyphenol oxidase family protein [Treponema sp.]|nr:polyphenol oxidase family protein [Treponema sp.]
MFNGKPIRDVFCFVSARQSGDMGLQSVENRRRFAETLFPSEVKNSGTDIKLYACRQTHSQNVVVVEADSPLVFENADGLVMFQGAGKILSVTVADCLPVFLFDTDSGTFGVVHSGWSGTGIVLNALRLMKTRPEAAAVVFGPCICGHCYHVDEKRRRIFSEKFGGVGGEYPLGAVVSGDCLDLKAANARLLTRNGVKNLAYCEDCTFTDQRLGSFRREGEHFTRMLVGVAGFSSP